MGAFPQRLKGALPHRLKGVLHQRLTALPLCFLIVSGPLFLSFLRLTAPLSFPRAAPVFSLRLTDPLTLCFPCT